MVNFKYEGKITKKSKKTLEDAKYDMMMFSKLCGFPVNEYSLNFSFKDRRVVNNIMCEINKIK